MSRQRHPSGWPLMIGRTIAHYEVLDKLGAGGMGVVYRAQDTRLDREVAIKALPEDFAGDSERLARLEREAKVLASLNHPHIASIHELEKAEGQLFLILEMVEGETLAERIAKGPIPVREALELACQIAEALEAAHEHEIIHRDLKPANVKVTPDGQVKVLDFGLAKAVVPEIPEVDLSHSPTLTADMTREGVLLGTAAYMSPEQARGQEAGKQTDIWAFGCVLYEMLTGRRIFLRLTTADTRAAILEREPDWEPLPEEIPALARSALQRCLEKDLKRRLHDIADARIELEEALREPAPGPERLLPATARLGLRRRALWTLGGLLLAAALGFGGWLWTRPGPAAPPVRRFQLQPPTGVSVARTDARATLAVSPDGTWVAFVGHRIDDPASRRLYLRSVEELQARPVPGTQNAWNPFFSQDSRWLGFYADDKLRKVPVKGGEPVPICDAPELRGASWGEDGTILFAAGDTGLLRVPGEGGEAELLTALDPEEGAISHRWPQILAGGRAALFVVKGALEATSGIAVLSLETGQYRTLLTGGTYPRYVPTGHLVYSRLGALYAVAFDLERLEVTGRPRRVLEDVYHSYWSGFVAYDLAKSGSLVYAPGAPQLSDRQLVWVDREGNVEPFFETRRPFGGRAVFSPERSRLAIEIESTVEDHDIWIYEIERQNWTRMTFNGGNVPLWSPDGKWIVFSSNRTGSFRLFRIAADGTGEAQQLTFDEGAGWEFPESFSPDGKVLAFRRYGAHAKWDLLLLPFPDGAVPRPFLADPDSGESRLAFSPDGKWVAYRSDESGRNEIYLRPYPGPGPKVKVSTNGGDEPDWNPNGEELLYWGLDRTIWATPVQTEPEFTVGRPRLLCKADMNAEPWLVPFTVSPDGQRFLMVRYPEKTEEPLMLVYVPSWPEELRRAVSGEVD